MRKTAIALAIVLAAAVGCKESGGSVAPLQVKGTTLYAGDEVFCAHGISFGWHNLWPRFYNAGAVKTLNGDWGCPIFRVAIGADSHARADNPGCLDGYMGDCQTALNCACNVIDAAIGCGAYVIVDWHSHRLHLAEASEFFNQIAQRYKGVPNVIYELFNEPVCASFEENGSYESLGDPQSMQAYWKELKAYAEELIKVITSIDDSQPLILMGCPCWDQSIDLVAADPLDCYGNLMYTVHFYAATHKAELRERCDAALQAGIPMFISECAACEASGDGPMNLESWDAWNAWAAQNGITMLAWSISDKVETCSMLTKEASSEGPWSEDVIKPWGKIVKEWL